jgi:hypothetical protein
MISGEQELITNSWQEAIDKWAIERSVGNTGYIIGTYMGKEKIFEDHQDISEWSKFLLDNNYNRIEKRLMTEVAFEQEYDGMEVVDVKDDMRFRDQIPKLMGKVFGGSEKLKESLNFHGNFEEMSQDEQDRIINPKHYKMIPKEAYERFPEGLEYMDLMEYILSHHKGVESHLLGQIFKYACRLGKKDAKLQDARKIEWYARRLVEVIENDKSTDS